MSTGKAAFDNLSDAEQAVIRRMARAYFDKMESAWGDMVQEIELRFNVSTEVAEEILVGGTTE